MPHMKSVIFPESKFALLFQHTTENNLWRQKQHIMKVWSIYNEQIKLVLKNSVLAPKHITINYLNFALIAMETEIH